MRVVILSEWDVSKNEDYYKKSLELMTRFIEYWEKLSKESRSSLFMIRFSRIMRIITVTGPNMRA